MQQAVGYNPIYGQLAQGAPFAAVLNEETNSHRTRINARIERYARLEEDVPQPIPVKVGTVAKKNNRRDAKKPRREDNNNRGKRTNEGVYTIFKDPIYKIPRFATSPFSNGP